MICRSLMSPFLELPQMPLKCPHEAIAGSSLHSSVQIIRQDVPEPTVGHYARGPLKSPACCRSQAPPSFLRHLDMPSIQPQQRNEKIGRDKKGEYDEEMAVWVERRVGKEKGLKLQVLGSIRYSDQNKLLDINSHLLQVLRS
jgi:hypothetical protein